MQKIRVISGLAALLCAAGCSSTYAVKLDGDVQGTDKDTPRVVRADVHYATEARSTREAAGRHLRSLPDASVTVQLHFKSQEKPKHSQTVKVDSQTAQFHYEAQGESKDGALVGVVVRVTCAGRQPVERELAAAPDVPFEEVVMAVLDETGPGAQAAAPDAAKPASAGK